MKPITVKQLIVGLKTMDQDALVGISTDSEGNGYSLIANTAYIVNEVYLKNELGGQDTYYTEEDLKKDGDEVEDFYGEKTKKTKLAKCVILWPTN